MRGTAWRGCKEPRDVYGVHDVPVERPGQDIGIFTELQAIAMAPRHAVGPQRIVLHGEGHRVARYCHIRTRQSLAFTKQWAIGLAIKEAVLLLIAGYDVSADLEKDPDLAIQIEMELDRAIIGPVHLITH